MTENNSMAYVQEEFAKLSEKYNERPCCKMRCFEKLCQNWLQFANPVHTIWTKSTRDRYSELKNVIGSQDIVISGNGRRSFAKKLPFVGTVCNKIFFWYYKLTEKRLKTILDDIFDTQNPSAPFFFKNKVRDNKAIFHDIVQPHVVDWMLELSDNLAETDPRRDWRQNFAPNGLVYEYLPPRYKGIFLFKKFLTWFQANHPEDYWYCNNYYTNKSQAKKFPIAEKTFKRYLQSHEISHIKTRPPKDNVCDPVPTDHSHADGETGPQHDTEGVNTNSMPRNEKGELLVTCTNCKELGHPESLCLLPTARVPAITITKDVNEVEME